MIYHVLQWLLFFRLPLATALLLTAERSQIASTEPVLMDIRAVSNARSREP
jgi:hypothetical protein